MAQTKRNSLKKQIAGANPKSEAVDAVLGKLSADEATVSVNPVLAKKGNATTHISVKRAVKDAERETRSKRVQILITPSLYKKISAQAKQTGTSMNNIINVVLEEVLENNVK